MIKAIRRGARALFAVGLLLLPGLAAAAGPPRPLLWTVSDGDNAVHLLGTFHLLRPGDYPLDPRVDAAFDDADVVVFELSPEALADPALGRRFAEAGLRTDGRTLQQELDARTWKATTAHAASAGVPTVALQAMEPWFAALTLTMVRMAAAGLDPELGLDRHLAKRAVLAGKRTAGLETVDEQIALFDGMPPDVQRAQLADVVARWSAIDGEIDALHRAWRDGDAEALYRGTAAPLKRLDPALYARINSDRNAAWFGRIKALLDDPAGHDALVAVGSLHLLGEEGLVERFAAAGYAVERR